MNAMTMQAVVAPWAAVDAALGLTGPVRDDAHYRRLLDFVETAFDEFGADESHPIFGLVNVVADHIREYENRVHPWAAESSPTAMLAFLMDQHGLRQSDLPEVGTQSVVSEILSGKRQLNLRQARALAARFCVPLDLFAGED
jgi:Predicted transcription regulator containing HTH domain